MDVYTRCPGCKSDQWADVDFDRDEEGRERAFLTCASCHHCWDEDPVPQKTLGSYLLDYLLGYIVLSVGVLGTFWILMQIFP